MVLNALSLTNFRVFNRLEVELPQHVLLLVGENAQGKTSFLEAIYFLTTINSLNASHDRQLINFSALRDPIPVARLVATFDRMESSHHLEIRLILEAGVNGNGRLRKEILMDGVKRNLQSSVGLFNSVLFLPQMMRILEGGPDERRKYLDNFISQVHPEYSRAVNEYATAVTQRNALLKQLAERGGDDDQLTYWDELVSSNGSAIIFQRIHAIQEIEGIAANEYRVLTHGRESIQLNYQPGYDPDQDYSAQLKLNILSAMQRRVIPPEEINAGFLQQLKRTRREDIQRGMTSIGPHRDELRVVGNGIDLGIYGSRGQVRSAVMSLKLAELKWLQIKTGEWPLLMLDETMAELDHPRRQDLMDRVQQFNQVILTTTDRHLFTEEFIQKSSLWKVEGGRITRS
jgi:DNA replication and repair protein RecF